MKSLHCSLDRFGVAQNVVIYTDFGDYKTTLSDLVRQWYDEVKDFDSHHVSRYR